MDCDVTDCNRQGKIVGYFADMPVRHCKFHRHIFDRLVTSKEERIGINGQRYGNDDGKCDKNRKVQN